MVSHGLHQAHHPVSCVFSVTSFCYANVEEVIYASMDVGMGRVQNSMADPLQLDLEAVVSYQVWVLGISPEFSVRTVCIPTVSPAPSLIYFYVCVSVCVHMHVVPTDATRSFQVPWNWS